MGWGQKPDITVTKVAGKVTGDPFKSLCSVKQDTYDECVNQLLTIKWWLAHASIVPLASGAHIVKGAF